MESYIQAKLSLLTKPGLEFVVVNLDDAESAKFCEMTPKNAQLWGVSRHGKRVDYAESVIATNVKTLTQGFAITVAWRTQQQEFLLPLYGEFNVDNVLLVLAVLLALGIDFDQATQRLTRLQPIAGRMEAYIYPNSPSVFIDYAHTPDALATVLSGVRQHCPQALWVVFGCGGNRDKGKRPLMRRAAERWADRVIITDDNPRDENSADIIQDIMSDADADKIVVMPDRASAIGYAIKHAQANDCIVVAGKGHENYQEIKGVRYPFSDKQTVLTALNNKREMA
nr:UDP-N-acetylmuramyl-tripeptide synthetase [Methylocucumis oryzae]